MKRCHSVGIVALAGLLAFGCMVNPKVGDKQHASMEVAPPLEGKDANGQMVRLADFRGKVVLVDFWQSM